MMLCCVTCCPPMHDFRHISVQQWTKSNLKTQNYILNSCDGKWLHISVAEINSSITAKDGIGKRNVTKTERK